MLVDIVAREERLDVDLYSKQITNRVRVFDPVKPMKGLGPPRIRLGDREPIKLGLEPAGNLLIRSVVGPRSTNRWHRPRPQLLDDLLPDVAMLAYPRWVEILQRELGRTQPIAVAGHTVAVEGA